ncbi:cryptochrome/photolyase family protein [Nocardioides sp. GCM10027113]|uniref:cryptochrome/photolyase family protein n=1 Tax=unclassified Nocardioides TaxID=2615069 RepID=UPI00360AB205
MRLVLPHQLFAEHLEAPAGTVFVLVEHDLLFRQYRFHAQKLVLHRASMRRFADRLREASYDVEVVPTDASRSSREQLAALLRELDPDEVTVLDVVDDWLARDLRAAVSDAGLELGEEQVLESPGFLTSRADLRSFFGDGRPRMQSFYAWQRRRLDVLVEDGGPVGGRWSFDEENRKKLPKGHPVPDVPSPDRHPEVEEAIAWVSEEFPDAPGSAESFRWPTSPDEAEAALEAFLADRLGEFGPYEDAISAEHAVVFHSLLTPALNIGLISPRRVLERVLEHAEDRAGGDDEVPLASLEGFVRQLIGWREYMRAVYELHGRRLRSGNHLGHARPLGEGWWTGETGLDPVDLVLRRVLDTGYAHHIERLMVLGNAMCLLRVDPDAAYEWFMEMFVDAYDWVMVPNVYAMSQFAAGDAITTKPYVSGSNYLRKMSDLPRGDWCDDWDALYWTFVRDHQDVFAGNPRSRMISNLYDRMDPGTKGAHTRRARGLMGG